MRYRSRRLIVLVVAALTLAACSPATTVSRESAYVPGSYGGPIEGLALVMGKPVRRYDGLASAVYLQSLTGFMRHPYARQRFDMVERSEIDLIMQEYQLGSSGYVDAATAPRLGQLLGANYIVIVDVVSGDVRQGSVGGLRIGSSRVGVGGATVNVGLSMRMIDVTTGRVLSAGFGEVTGAVLTGLSISGFGVDTPATPEMIRDLLPEAVSRTLNELFANLGN